jgi:hypothetical protein
MAAATWCAYSDNDPAACLRDAPGPVETAPGRTAVIEEMQSHEFDPRSHDR